MEGGRDCIAGLLVDYGIRAVAVAHGYSKAHCHMAGQAGYGPTIAKKAVTSARATGSGEIFWLVFYVRA